MIEPKIDLGGLSPKEFCKISGFDLRKLKCRCELITNNHFGYEFWVIHVINKCDDYLDFWKVGGSYCIS